MTAESSSLASTEITSAIFRMVSNISFHILSDADSSRLLPVVSRKSAPMVSIARLFSLSEKKLLNLK